MEITMAIKHNDHDSLQSLETDFSDGKVSVGIFEASRNKFTPEQYERVTILKGSLIAGSETIAKDESYSKEYRSGEMLMLTLRTEYFFTCNSPVAYFCEYSDTPFSDES